MVDGVLVVVSANKTPRKLLEEALNELDPAKVVGIVFNNDDRPLYGYDTNYRRYFSRKPLVRLSRTLRHSIRRKPCPRSRHPIAWCFFSPGSSRPRRAAVRRIQRGRPTTRQRRRRSSTGRTGGVTVTVNPNPVPFDGKPITDVAGCASRNNTWYYELTLKETGGAPVTFNAQIDAFDGFVVNNLTGIKVDGAGQRRGQAEPAVVQLDEREAHRPAHVQRHRLRTATPSTCSRQLINLMANTESKNCMCGIVGYIGTSTAVDVLVPALKRLEYRGYDSAGVATINGHGLEICKALGKISNLEAQFAKVGSPAGSLGIAHTRWATHGRPVRSERASARRLRQPPGRRPQRHHREPPAASRVADGEGAHVPVADRHRSHRAPHRVASPADRRRSDRGHLARGQRAERLVRHRVHRRRSSRHARRRARRRLAAGAGPRQRRNVSRVRHPGAARTQPRGGRARRRGRRHSDSRQGEHSAARWAHASGGARRPSR